MRINILLGVIVTLAFSFTGNAQICGTDYFLEKEYQKDPSFQNVVEQNWVMNDLPSNPVQGAEAVKIVPVVFHVFHDNGDGNISYEQIESAMEMINEDFRRTNSDAASTRAIFAPYAADSEIEFRLAKIDPNGDCTNGVVRMNTPLAVNAGNNVKSLSYWPSNKYFNVWVVKSIESSGVNGIILGYAQFPGSGSWSTYGVVIRNDRVGRMGTANSQDRTLTHEIGHCFNLLHTFQSGCGSNCQSSGDRVCDTPPVSNSTQGCSQSQNLCNNDTQGSSVYTTNVVDQIENYMSYDDCQNMFSLGQKSRMQSVLANSSTLSQLTSATNLANTGALTTVTGVCQANFDVANQIVCVGDTINFMDQSYFNPDSFLWEFEGGFPSVSSTQNPTVVYDTPGKYKVSLTISDLTSATATNVKVDYITVISSEGLTSPFSESFESTNSLESMNWFSPPVNNNLGWSKVSSGGASGVYALKANAFNKTGTITIESPAYDVSNMTSALVKFDYAYAGRSNGGNSYLRVYASTNCGETWMLKWISGGSSMETRPAQANPYNNPQASDWSTESFTIPASQVNSNLRLKFEFKSNNGNNLFVDDINVNGLYSSHVVLSSPKNGATGLSAAQVLDWKATSQADYYTIEIDTTPLFNSTALITQQIQYLTVVSTDMDTEYLTQGLSNGVIYYWRVRSEIAGLTNLWSETWSFSVNVNGLGKEVAVSNDVLVKVYPNPAHEQVNVNLNMVRTELVEINVFDITGNLVQNSFTGMVPRGESNHQINRTGWSNGIYLIQVKSGTSVQTVRVILN